MPYTGVVRVALPVTCNRKQSQGFRLTICLLLFTRYHTLYSYTPRSYAETTLLICSRNNDEKCRCNTVLCLSIKEKLETGFTCKKTRKMMEGTTAHFATTHTHTHTQPQVDTHANALCKIHKCAYAPLTHYH